MRVLLMRRHIIVRLCCESLVRKHQTRLPGALCQTINRSSSSDIFHRTSLARQSSHTTPTGPIPYAHLRPILTQPLVMSAVQEEKNPKRQREGDGTLSPPAKKTHHIELTRVADEREMDEIFGQPQGGEVGTLESDVVMAEERIEQEHSQNDDILKGRETIRGEALLLPTFTQHEQSQGGEVMTPESDVVMAEERIEQENSQTDILKGRETIRGEALLGPTFSQQEQSQGEVGTPESDVVMAEERIEQENSQNYDILKRRETVMGEALLAPTISQQEQPHREIIATESDVVEEILRQEPTHTTEKKNELKSNRETEDNFAVKKSAVASNTEVERERSHELIVKDGTENGFPVGGEPVMESTTEGMTGEGVLSSGREIREETGKSGTRRDVTLGEGTPIEQSLGELCKVDLAPEKQADTKFLHQGTKELSSVAPLRESKSIETDMELTGKETYKSELMSSDMDSMPMRKRDDEISLMEEVRKEEMASPRSLNLSASTTRRKMDGNKSIQTHTLDREPTDRLTDEPRDTGRPTDLPDISLGSRTEKRSKTKEKKHSSQKRRKGNVSGERKDLRPNYFVGIQVSNPGIHQGLLKVQEDLVAWNDVMIRALVDIATSHLTLLVAHIGTEEALAVACAALEESAKRLGDGVSACPLSLTFSGVSSFSNQVIFARVLEDDQYQRLLDMGECVRRVFEEHGVCMPDTRELHPHLTIAKLSKAPHRKGKPGVKKVDPSCYSHHHDRHFGTQTVAGLQLLSMNKSKDECRYYHSEKEVLFDIDIEESKDHSGCCFPRRPILPITQSRAYTTTTTTTREEESSGGGRWMMPVAGVATLVAAALVMGFVLARVRGSQ